MRYFFFRSSHLYILFSMLQQGIRFVHRSLGPVSALSTNPLTSFWSAWLSLAPLPDLAGNSLNYFEFAFAALGRILSSLLFVERSIHMFVFSPLRCFR